MHRKRISTLILLLITAYLVCCIAQSAAERAPAAFEGSYTLYYMVNVDGMKGLGHSILFLTDEQGTGTVISFNGMQTTLGEALMGAAGVGKMSIGTMSAAETNDFLQTGDLDLGADQLQDNYDLALYRPITAEEYQAVIALTEPYLQTGSRYEQLYALMTAADGEERADYVAKMAEMAEDESLPLYRLYTHNCDDAARLLAAAVDEEMAAYNTGSRRLTPNGNVKAFARRAADWGVLRMGDRTPAERVLEFLMIF